MTIKTHEHSRYLKGYWHQPVMLQFVQSVQMSAINRLTGYEIGRTVDRFDRIQLLVVRWFIVKPCPACIGTIKIPIEKLVAERPQLHPAVSSLEACPTPAH